MCSGGVSHVCACARVLYVCLVRVCVHVGGGGVGGGVADGWQLRGWEA